MKIIILILLILQVNISFSQKIKYKEPYALIKEKKFDEALPLLEQFLIQKPNHVNANYWAGKIYDSNAFKYVDRKMAKKAEGYYLKAKQNVSQIEMNVVNSKRFPDVRGMETDIRLKNFNTFIAKRQLSLQNFNRGITSLNENFEFNSIEELEKKYSILLSNKIKSYNLHSIKGSINKEKLLEIVVNRGVLEFVGSCDSIREQVKYTVDIDRQLLSKETLKELGKKNLKKNISDITFEKFEKMVGYEFIKYTEIRKDEIVSGFIKGYGYDNQFYPQGIFKIEDEQGIECSGEIEKENTVFKINWENFDVYSEFGAKITYKNDKIYELYYELLYDTPVMLVINDVPQNFTFIKVFDAELMNIPTKMVKSESLKLKYYGHNIVDETTDVIESGYIFVNVNNKEIFYDDFLVESKVLEFLDNNSNVNKWVELKSSTFNYQSKLFTDLPKINKITEAKLITDYSTFENKLIENSSSNGSVTEFSINEIDAFFGFDIAKYFEMYDEVFNGEIYYLKNNKGNISHGSFNFSSYSNEKELSSEYRIVGNVKNGMGNLNYVHHVDNDGERYFEVIKLDLKNDKVINYRYEIFDGYCDNIDVYETSSNINCIIPSSMQLKRAKVEFLYKGNTEVLLFESIEDDRCGEFYNFSRKNKSTVGFYGSQIPREYREVLKTNIGKRKLFTVSTGVYSVKAELIENVSNVTRISNLRIK